MPTLPMTMVHLLCTSGTTSRVVWLKQQCSSVLALAVPPVRAAHSPFSRPGVIDADDPHLMSAYEAFANTPPSPHGGADTRLVVELEMPQALALIRTHGRLLLDAAHRTGSFLYRGESLGELPQGGEGVGGPRAVIETPDLFDDQTYGSSAASEYFRAVDRIMDRKFHAQARPATAHIMVSNKEVAAEWGTACSIWPLGGSLDYSWLKDCAEWWNPGWDNRSDGGVSLVNGERRQALFWRDDQSLESFLSGNLRVNRGLPEALRRGHEVLVRGGEFTASLVRGNDGGTQISVRDAFVCIPASADSEVRSALGVPLSEKSVARCDRDW